MSKKLSKSYQIVSIAIMAALAIVFDVISETLPLRVPWGMQIDFVGTIWVLSYFLYGLSVAFPVSIMTTIFIVFFSTTGVIGGAMKFIATIPMFLVPALFSYLPFFPNHNSKIFNKLTLLIGATVLASAVRLTLATILNLYWAIPVYYGMAPSQALAFFGGVFPLVLFVAGFNLLQGIIDIFVPWILAFKFKLSTMFGTW